MKECHASRQVFFLKKVHIFRVLFFVVVGGGGRSSNTRKK